MSSHTLVTTAGFELQTSYIGTYKVVTKSGKISKTEESKDLS